jgi:hypothetical protein
MFIVYAQSSARGVRGSRRKILVTRQARFFTAYFVRHHCPTQACLVFFFFFSLLSCIHGSHAAQFRSRFCGAFACFARAELSHLRRVRPSITRTIERHNSATVQYAHHAHLSPVIPKYVSSVPSATVRLYRLRFNAPSVTLLVLKAPNVGERIRGICNKVPDRSR